MIVSLDSSGKAVYVHAHAPPVIPSLPQVPRLYPVVELLVRRTNTGGGPTRLIQQSSKAAVETVNDLPGSSAQSGRLFCVQF